jgi:hypothetical protein
MHRPFVNFNFCQKLSGTGTVKKRKCGVDSKVAGQNVELKVSKINRLKLPLSLHNQVKYQQSIHASITMVTNSSIQF